MSTSLATAAVAFPIDDTSANLSVGARKILRSPHRILLVDPSPISRECLAYTLQSRVKDLVIEGVARCGDASMQDPDAVLIDIKGATAGEHEASKEIAAIRNRYGHARILVLSNLIDASAAVTSIRNGADGYVPTSLSLDILVAALGLVLAGGIFIPTELIAPYAFSQSTSQSAPKPTAPDLQMVPNDRSFTTRELQVVTRLREGKPNKIIAHELDISVSTVKVHIRNVMKKLHATNRTQVCTAHGAGEPSPGLLAAG